jgi:hypothetical protein
MRLVDANVLVYAERGEMAQHKVCHAFVTDMVNGDESYAVTDFVVSVSSGW